MHHKDPRSVCYPSATEEFSPAPCASEETRVSHPNMLQEPSQSRLGRDSIRANSRALKMKEPFAQAMTITHVISSHGMGWRTAERTHVIGLSFPPSDAGDHGTGLRETVLAPVACGETACFSCHARANGCAFRALCKRPLQRLGLTSDRHGFRALDRRCISCRRQRR